MTLRWHCSGWSCLVWGLQVIFIIIIIIMILLQYYYLLFIYLEWVEWWQQIPSKISLGTNNGPTPPPRDWLATTLYCIILELNLLNSTCWLCVYPTSGIGRASAPSVVTVRSLFHTRNKGHILKREEAEGHILSDLVLFLSRSSAQGQDERFSCKGSGGARLILRGHAVREAIKITCDLNDLPEISSRPTR